jgi:hypothetical protein
LVPLFQAAKRRRQVIIVTHNANLVINTDADQIIAAEVGTASAVGCRRSATNRAVWTKSRFAPWSATSSKAANWPSGTARGVSGLV